MVKKKQTSHRSGLNPEGRSEAWKRIQLRRAKERRRRAILMGAGAIIFLLLLLIGIGIFRKKNTPPPVAEDIYAYLTRELGYPEAVACGIMANIEQESFFYSNNLQGKFEKILGESDTSYTEKVDSGKISAEDFANDSAGYGLVQWSYNTRKAKLLEYAKERKVSISDYRMQLDFMNSEIGKKKREYLMSLPNTRDGAIEAGRYFCAEYEKPANKNAPKLRSQIAGEYYDKYVKGM